MLIINGTVLHDDGLKAASLRTDGAIIAAIAPGLPPLPGEEMLDATGCYLLPGFIDLHTHGLQHVSVQEGGWMEYAGLQLEQGVTGCLPTLFGAPEILIGAMRAAHQETNHLCSTPNLLGFRLEMPYLAKPGAGQASSLVPISPKSTAAMFEAGDGHIRLWDVSPELDGAAAFIRWASEHGIVTSMAHTRCSVEQAQRAIDAGLALVTHFYDTFDPPPMSDAGVYPAGLVDYIQIEDRLTVEIIPDGVHVHPYLVEKTFRCKGVDRIAFITDSVRGAGRPPGIYAGLYPGVEVEVTANRGVRRQPDDALSGSALTMLEAFRRAIRVYGHSIPEASALCSRTAARVLGETRKGRLLPGLDADLLVLSSDLELRATLLGGHVAWRREQ